MESNIQPRHLPLHDSFLFLCVCRPERHRAGVSGRCVLDGIARRRCERPAAPPSALVGPSPGHRGSCLLPAGLQVVFF